MSEKVDQVALAICPLIHDRPHRNFDCPKDCWDCKAVAIAAIQAMREPTPEMIRDGAPFDPKYWGNPLDGYNRAKGIAKIVWQAMVDEALK